MQADSKQQKAANRLVGKIRIEQIFIATAFVTYAKYGCATLLYGYAGYAKLRKLAPDIAGKKCPYQTIKQTTRLIGCQLAFS